MKAAARKHLHELKPGDVFSFDSDMYKPRTNVLLWNIAPEKAWTSIHRCVGFLSDDLVETMEPFGPIPVCLVFDE